MKRAIPLAVLLLVLVGGCTGDDSDAPNSGPSGGSAASEPVDDENTEPPVPGGAEVPPAADECGLTADEVAVLNRDWGRVAGAVGRPDIHKYTKPFAALMDRLAVEATACPEPELLKRMRDLAAKLDRDAAARREVAMEDVNDFLETGNAWLEALGYGANSLPTG